MSSYEERRSGKSDMSDTSNNVAEQVLKSLGLDAVCIKVYLTMHAVPDADMMQIAELLDLQPAEVIDALDELSDLTLLRAGLTTEHRLRPVSIERAIQALLRQQSEQLKVQSGSLAMLQSAMKELLESRPVHESGFGQADVLTITGEEPAQLHIEQLTLRAADSVYSLMPGRSLPPEMLEAARPFDEEICQRGVTVRALYQSAVKSDRRTLEYVRWLGSIGSEIRFAPVVPLRLILLDRTTAVLFRRDVQLPLETFVIREPAILGPLIELYEQSWAAAAPLDDHEPKPSDGNAPSAQELALLRLLASGSTDEAAGKKLGISVRTVRRIMADLMERLEASSRFEAGHKATQRGWL
jgi:DNA-binding CsgD family transcriptional regulator